VEGDQAVRRRRLRHLAPAGAGEDGCASPLDVHDDRIVEGDLDDGLVAERRAGRNVYYRSDARGLDALAQWVQRYRVFWPGRVEKLKRVLKDMDK
jgi:hypothetical protein